jgi:hypothetical protein
MTVTFEVMRWALRALVVIGADRHPVKLEEPQLV